jgi:hypothetical protein
LQTFDHFVFDASECRCDAVFDFTFDGTLAPVNGTPFAFQFCWRECFACFALKPDLV